MQRADLLAVHEMNLMQTTAAPMPPMQDLVRHADLLAIQGVNPNAEEDADDARVFGPYSSYVEREMGAVVNMVKVSGAAFPWELCSNHGPWCIRP